MNLSQQLEKLYGAENVNAQLERYDKALESFKKLYGDDEVRIFSAPGRTEVGGNHTDHNNGKVLAAAVNLDVIAIVAPTNDGVVRIKSEGFPEDVVDITSLEPEESEKNTSAALIRGVCRGFRDGGFNIGGFKAYTISTILKGSGLSSSAAFEVLVGTILSGLYNGSEVSAVKIAQIAQFAENQFFGKPSGLMDQMASSVGGFITIDFEDTKNPVIRSVNYDFAHSGHALCIVDTKGNHADLTPEYAAMPKEMKQVAAFFGKSCLRELSKADVLENIISLREKCGDRAVLRALHFFDENVRVDKQCEALDSGRFSDFLELIKASGNSSYKYLQNVYCGLNTAEEGLAVGLYIAENILGGEGASRVHGGGLAGTIQAFVPKAKLSEFKSEMERVFGKGSCYVLMVRPAGGTEIEIDG